MNVVKLIIVIANNNIAIAIKPYNMFVLIFILNMQLPHFQLC